MPRQQDAWHRTLVPIARAAKGGALIPVGAICIGGPRVCQSPADDFCPNPDRCVDFDVDLNDCGGCGVHAPAGGVCLGSVPQSTPGFHNDNGRCCSALEHNCGGCCSIFAGAVCPC
jgi:hypothetical protein